MSVGIVYAATGAAFVNEAIVSASSLKAQLSRQVPVTLITDQVVQHPCFDQVIAVPRERIHHPLQKVRLLGMSPYRVTLYLDTDTYITDDISELFELSSHFDIAAAHAPGRVTVPAPNIPAAFPEFNAGILLFSERVSLSKFCRHWLALFKLYGFQQGDQASFRLLTYRSRLRLATLPSEYNCRFLFTGFLRDRVKILHGHYRAEDFPKADAALNARLTWRTHSECKVFARGGTESGALELIGEYPFRNPFDGVVKA